MSRALNPLSVTLCTLLALASAGCRPAATGDAGQQGGTATEGMSGKIVINGSSTVYPISEAVAEEFGNKHSEAKIEVGFSGTGGGMKQFAAGELDIADASREMKAEEAAKCKEAGIEFIRLSVAYDGLAVVVHPENDWCDSLTVEQLKQIWQPEDPAQNWSDINPEWPDEKIVLYGPGTDSGTFDYFTEEIVGEAKSSRADYAQSEDDNTLVTGVAGNKYAMGYFGYAYYAENEGKLKVIGVDSGDGPVKPSMETVMDNSYSPLGRPLFIYVSKKSLERPLIKEFVKFYMDQAAGLAKEVGYVPVPEEVAAENQATMDANL